MPVVADRRLHQRRQEHAPERAHGGAVAGRRTSCSPRSIPLSTAAALPGGARGGDHRHGGLHPRSAQGSLRRVPRHVRGSATPISSPSCSTAPIPTTRRSWARSKPWRGLNLAANVRVLALNKCDLLPPGEGELLARRLGGAGHAGRCASRAWTTSSRGSRRGSGSGARRRGCPAWISCRNPRRPASSGQEWAALPFEDQISRLLGHSSARSTSGPSSWRWRCCFSGGSRTPAAARGCPWSSAAR